MDCGGQRRGDKGGGILTFRESLAFQKQNSGIDNAILGGANRKTGIFRTRV